jgi:hypothetical protein
MCTAIGKFGQDFFACGCARHRRHAAFPNIGSDRGDPAPRADGNARVPTVSQTPLTSPIVASQLPASYLFTSLT